MKLFLDSANLEEVKAVRALGILDGVTTNPSLIKKASLTFKKSDSMDLYITEILKAAKGVFVSLEVIGTDYDSMVREAELLYKKFNSVAQNVVVKIPINPSMDGQGTTSTDSIRAISYLAKKNIPVNCTLIFTPEQALLAAKAGATYVSPFVGRLDDYIRKLHKVSFTKKDYFPAQGLEKRMKVLDDNGVVSGIDLVAQIVALFEMYDIKTKVLAASIRNVRQFREAALCGADIATVPYSVILQLLDHPKTMEGMKSFTKDVVTEYKEVFRK